MPRARQGLEVSGSQGRLGRDFLLAGSQGAWHKEAGRQDGHVEQGESPELGSGSLRLTHQARFAHRTERPRGLQGACYRKTKAAASEVEASQTPEHPLSIAQGGSKAHTAAGTVCKGANPSVHTLTFSSVRPFSAESTTFCRMRCRNAWRREAGRYECPRLDLPVGGGGGARKEGLTFKHQVGPGKYHVQGHEQRIRKNYSAIQSTSVYGASTTSGPVQKPPQSPALLHHHGPLSDYY